WIISTRSYQWQRRRTVLAKCITRLLEGGENPLDLLPEIFAVVHVPKVGNLMRNDIVNDMAIEVDQTPVQHDCAITAARTPTRSGSRQSPALDAGLTSLQKVGKALLEPYRGLCLQ